MTPALLALALAAQAPAAAPPPVDPDAPAAVHEEHVVVVAERRAQPLSEAPAAVSVLDAERLARLPILGAAEAVAHLPGFHVLFASPFGGQPMETARGFFGGGEAGYVQMRVDGVPVSDLESGGGPWSLLAAGALARVEALRGTASPLYGDTALAGVVELRTLDAASQPPLALGLAAGRFETAAAEASAAARVGRLAATLDLDGRRTGGFRRHGAEERTAATLRLAPREPAGADWRLSLARAHERREEPGPLSFEAIAADPFASDSIFADDERHEDRTRAAASWERQAPVALALRAWGEERRSDALRTLLLAAGFGDATRRVLDASTLGASAIASGELPDLRVSWELGLEMAREELDGAHFAPGSAGAATASTAFALGPHASVDSAQHESALASAEGERRRVGAFASAAWSPAARLRVSAALRRDEVRDRFDATGATAAGVAGPEGGTRAAWSPRVALTATPRPGGPLAFFAQWAEAFKTPTLDQLFDPRPFPDGAGGTFTLANPALRPQRARTLELGARGMPSAAAGAGAGAALLPRWQVALYRTAVEDEIDFDPATFRYVNIGSSLHRGVELDADLWRGALGGHAAGRLGGGWEWSETVPRRGPNAGRQLKNLPVHTFRLVAAADLPGGVEAGLVGRHLEGRFLDDARRFPLGDATLVDLRVARRWGDWELRLDVWNLLDERFLWVGLALPDFAGGEVPYAFAGHPRAAMLGLRWRSGDPEIASLRSQ